MSDTDQTQKRQPHEWSRLTRRDVDIPAFLRRMEAMKRGETMKCPFCEGTVSMTASEDGLTIFACDSCDMNIRLEQHAAAGE